MNANHWLVLVLRVGGVRYYRQLFNLEAAMKNSLGLNLALISALSLLIPISPADAQVTASVPEIVVKDNAGNVIGAARVIGRTVQVLVHDLDNDEVFHLKLGMFWFRTFDSDTLWFTGANCTGQAWVYAHQVDSIALMRGSMYAVGPPIGGGQTIGHMYRSVDGEILADNSGVITTKWTLGNSDFGKFDGPMCSTETTASPTIKADVVAGLDDFVQTLAANKPYTLQ